MNNISTKARVSGHDAPFKGGAAQMNKASTTPESITQQFPTGALNVRRPIQSGTVQKHHDEPASRPTIRVGRSMPRGG